MAGQTNHFLATIVVGLKAVEDGFVHASESMPMAWAPNDAGRSAARSREFAVKAALAWTVDALDAYIRGLHQPPAVGSPRLAENIAALDENAGLPGRLRALCQATDQAGSAAALLVEIATIWRNRVVHSHARNQVRKPLITAAEKHSDTFQSHYQGLDIAQLLSRVTADRVKAPTFKEVTAIVRATHKVVERADGMLLAELNMPDYFSGVLGNYLNEAGADGMMKRATNVWGRTPEKSKSTIIQIARNSGFTDASSTTLGGVLLTSEIDAWVDIRPTEAIARLVPRSDHAQ